MNDVILDVRDLSLSFAMYDRLLERRELRVVSGLTLSVRAGEILAVAGSSGSGKSLLAHAILGILPSNAAIAGEMDFLGAPLTQPRKEAVRGREIALVPQSTTCLDPLMRVGKQAAGAHAISKQRETFARYGLDESMDSLYPFQLSGGMTRRVLLSTAVMSGARLIVADEPTPGLSVQLARRAMEHFRQLADEGRAVLLITHDIDLALAYADRVAVFYAGAAVETAPVGDFRGEETLRHPYTKALWRAMPQNGFQPIEGAQPYAGDLPSGCLFGPRCPMRTEICGELPPSRALRGGEVRCHHAT